MKMMPVMKRHILLLVILLCCRHLFADERPVRYLGIEHGLSNNAVTCIYQDAKGFMWFGTYDGLNRYDGYAFKIFRNIIGDTTSLADNAVYNLAGGNDGSLWVGGRKGISIYDPQRNLFAPAWYQPRTGKPLPLTNNIHQLRSTPGGTIMAGTENNGLLLFSSGSHTGATIPLRGDLHYEVTAIETSWIFVQHEGLYHFDTTSHALELVSSSIRHANCLQADAQGHLWLGNDSGLYRYDIATHQFSPNYCQEVSKIVSLCLDRQGTLWAALDGDGVMTLASGESKLVAQQGINSNAIYAVYEDTDGRKWIGSLRGGINLIEAHRNPFNTHRFGPRMTSNFMLSFAEDAHHNIWIGTDGDGLRYWDRAHDTYTTYQHDPQQAGSIGGNFITSILADDDQSVWVATWFAGVHRFDPRTRTFAHFTMYNPATKAEEKNAWLLYKDHQQRLWASTSNNGTLYIFNKALHQFEVFDPAISNVQCMAEDAQGQLWAGDYTSLIRIDPVHKRHKIFKLGYTVRSLHEDRYGNFWVGTESGGLLRFDRSSGHFERFTTAEGLPGNSILRMLEDERGRLWISTYTGLSCFDPQRKVFRNFTQSDGLQSNQFTFNAALKTGAGEMLFGGIKGFNIFYPDQVREDAAPLRLFIDNVRVDNKPVPIAATLTIPYNKASLAFDFVALEYTAPDKISYAWFLEGWDKSWTYSGALRQAIYTHLQEGVYVLHVKATNASGRWTGVAKTIRIIVLPPWYRSWWAYTAYVLLVFFTVYGYVKYKQRQERLRYEVQLARVEKEKEKDLNEKKLSFFTHVSHEFRTPLTLIINPLKAALQKGASPDDLGTIYRNARRLLSLVDQLLLFRKADTGADQLHISALDMRELCQEVYACFLQQARSKQIRYTFTCDAPSLPLFGDAEKLEIALFNLLSNAFKFTPDNGRIAVTVTPEEGGVCIVVQDSGSGIAPEAGRRIFEKFRQGERGKQSGFGIGLYLVRHFIESHRGRVQYESTPGQGTTFTVYLPEGAAPAGSLPEKCGKPELLEELMEEALPATAAQPASPASAGALVSEKQSLLIIDDQPEMRRYLQQLFRDSFIIYEAADGESGFALAQRCQPDLVISDVEMEGMDGITLCAQLKASEALGHIPVVLLTAGTRDETRLEGISGGADDYITKPFADEMLLARVHTLLKNRQLLRQYFFDRITLRESSVKVPAEYRDFLKRCIEIVEDNLDKDDFQVKKLATALGMSHSGLYRKVKAISGQSINAFVRSIRLRRAAVLMIRENYNVNQAAFQVGISDPKYFREQFARLFGMNPSAYIRRYRNAFSGELNLVKGED